MYVNVCRPLSETSSKKPPPVATKHSTGSAVSVASASTAATGRRGRPDDADHRTTTRPAAPDRPHSLPDKPHTSTNASDRSHTTTGRDRRPGTQSDRPDTSGPPTDRRDRPHTASMAPPLPDKPPVLDKPSLSTDRTGRDSTALNCGQAVSTDRQMRDGHRRGSSDTVKLMKPSLPPPPAGRHRQADNSSQPSV